MPLKYYLQLNPITPDPNDRSARIETSNTLKMEDIVKRMMKRGTMVTESDVLAVLNLYNEVVSDEIANGATVNLPLANFRPSIRGTFRDANDSFDPSRHIKRASVSQGLLLAEKMRNAAVEKVTTSLPSPEITEFVDFNSGESNAVLTPGGIGRVSGEELKFDQSQSDEGIFFVATDGSETRVEIIASLTEGQVMFQIPNTLTAGDYTLRIRRAYTSSRTIRTGQLDGNLTVA